MGVTVEYYRNTWGGSFAGSNTALTTLLSRATDVIDNAIYISGKTVNDITGAQQTRVYNAVCAQADYIDDAGGINSLTSNGFASATIGKFSFSAGSTGTAAESCCLCDTSRNYLLPTGLLCKAVGVC